MIAAVTVCGLLWSGMEASAADVAGMEISSQADTVRKGQEIDLTFSLEGYTDIKSGVNALKGTLEYDSAVFGVVSQEDFETVNSWEKQRVSRASVKVILSMENMTQGSALRIPG